MPPQLEDYIPSAGDILRTRIRSTGIEEAEFKFQDMSFVYEAMFLPAGLCINQSSVDSMTDVGGQRSERRKWIHCFENSVTAVIFCAAMSCYDQVLPEDGITNCMKETLALFEEIASSTYFKGSAMILLLNKKDLFEEKILTVDPKVWHPGYTGTFATVTAFFSVPFLIQTYRRWL